MEIMLITNINSFNLFFTFVAYLSAPVLVYFAAVSFFRN